VSRRCEEQWRCRAQSSFRTPVTPRPHWDCQDPRTGYISATGTNGRKKYKKLLTFHKVCPLIHLPGNHSSPILLLSNFADSKARHSRHEHTCNPNNRRTAMKKMSSRPAWVPYWDPVWWKLMPQGSDSSATTLLLSSMKTNKRQTDKHLEMAARLQNKTLEWAWILD